jgi:hypothetical protein
MRVLPDDCGRSSLDDQCVVKTPSPSGSATELPVPTSVSIFLAERDTGSTADGDIGQAHRALAAAARRVGSGDHRVRYLRTIYVAAEHRCIFLFEASDAAIVRLVNDTAQLPLLRIAEAVEFASELPAVQAEP